MNEASPWNVCAAVQVLALVKFNCRDLPVELTPFDVVNDPVWPSICDTPADAVEDQEATPELVSCNTPVAPVLPGIVVHVVPFHCAMSPGLTPTGARALNPALAVVCPVPPLVIGTVGSLAELSVPEPILLALVASVVADGAKLVPPVLVQVMAPRLVTVQSPDRALAIARLDALPMNRSPLVSGNPEPSVSCTKAVDAHLLLLSPAAAVGHI